jgi:hypothetical protein
MCMHWWNKKNCNNMHREKIKNYTLLTFSVLIHLSCYVLQTCYIMHVKLYSWNCSGDRQLNVGLPWSKVFLVVCLTAMTVHTWRMACSKQSVWPTVPLTYSTVFRLFILTLPRNWQISLDVALKSTLTAPCVLWLLERWAWKLCICHIKC